MQDAVIRNFENIGEAGHQLTRHAPDWLAKNPEFQLQLRLAYTMHNRLSHGYFEVDLDTVWNTVQQDIPRLLAWVKKLQVSSLP